MGTLSRKALLEKQTFLTILQSQIENRKQQAYIVCGTHWYLLDFAISENETKNKKREGKGEKRLLVLAGQVLTIL